MPFPKNQKLSVAPIAWISFENNLENYFSILDIGGADGCNRACGTLLLRQFWTPVF
jgi:hypothetical protein